MSIDTGVRLESNKKYWSAAWRDSRGKRCRESIGAKSKFSRREALAACNRIASAHAVQPSRRDLREAPGLADWCTRYLTLRDDLGEATLTLHRETIAYLGRFFNPELPIDKLARSAATDWRAWLVKQPSRGATLSECTVCRHVRTAKVIFKYALDEDLIPLNPFGRLQGTPAHHDAEFEIVDRPALERILAQCPDRGWRALFALTRLAGLRQGEAMRLRWGDVDFAEGTLIVLPKADGAGRRRETTKQRRRVVPIEPGLATVLQDCYDQAEAGEELVCPVLFNNLRRTAHRIVKKAGLPEYPKPFHTLRKNLETEWLDQHPVMTVCRWLGNSPAVAAQHYHQPTRESIAKVTGKPISPKQEAAAS